MTAPLKAAGYMRARFPHLAGAPLTAIEQRVVELVADGWENAEIGEALWLSPATVKNHVERVAAKFEARDRAGIVVAAYRARCLQPRPLPPGVAPPRPAGRPRQVLRLVRRGLSTQEIAARLELSVPTVKSHLRTVLGVLGASNRAHAIRLAVDAGLLQITPARPRGGALATAAAEACPPPGVARPMSPVERRILARLARGETYFQIAAAESLSRSAVCKHVTGIHVLLGVGSSAHSVAAAHRLGLLPRERFARPDLDGEDLQLLRWIANGAPDRVIGSRLGIRPSVAAERSRRLYGRMFARNRPNAVHIGYCTGLLGAEGLNDDGREQAC